jgi:DNA-binding response OmpR family regulator
VHIFLPEAERRKISLLYGSGVQGNYLFDTQKLQQIGYNLLANALKFTPEGGQVVVSIQPAPADETGRYREKETRVALKVSDTGIGIPADYLPYIFNRFYQAPSHPAFSQPGTGIGLSLVKELIELLGGKVTAESQVGLGTTFTVIIPLLEVEGAWVPETASLLQGPTSFDWSFSSAALPQELYHSAEAPLLLVVEDNTELKEFIAGELASQYRVLTAGNGREGMDITLRALPDVVISDVMMPEMDGYALCQWIKTTPQTSHIAFILLTARASHERIMEGLTYGADEYLTKPFHLEELGLRLRNLLDRQAKLRAFYKRQLEHLDQPAGETAQPAVQDAFLQRIQAIMDQHLDDPALGPELLAREIGMTPRNLSRKLNALAGTSPARMIRNFRLQKAASLLQSRHSVAEAAYATGFESPSYFATAFKEHFGQTPSEFASAAPLPDPSVKNA